MHQAHRYLEIGRRLQGARITQARTSLMKHAPAATAARITAGREVSIEIGTDADRASRSMTGTTRAISSATDGGGDPGRVD